ncbi:MFS transporter [Pandoraea terrae]
MPAKRPTRQRYVLAAILLAVLFFSYIDRVNVSILVVDPEFLAAMGIANDAVRKGLLMTVFLTAYGIGNVVLSPIGDKIGARKGMALSILFWAFSLLIGGVATAFMTMLVSRMILGMSEGLHFPLQNKYVKDWFPVSERGKANSVWQAGLSVAPALAMPVFTFIVHTSGWRSSFFILSALGLIPLALVWFMTTDTPREHKKVNALELAHIESSLQAENGSLENRGSFTEGIRSFARNYRFWLLVAYYSLHVSVFWGALTWLPTYLKEAKGFSWSAMGALSSLPWIMALATKIAAGYVCDRTGHRASLIFASMVVVSVGVFFGATLSDPLVSTILLSFGIGALGFALPPIWTMLQDIVPSNAISVGAGVMNGVANGLSALAPMVIGFVIHMTGSYADGLYSLVCCSVLAACIMLIMMIKGTQRVLQQPAQ